MFNVDLRGCSRGKCICAECDEFLLRNKDDLSHNGWCNYCNHSPVDHELLKNPRANAVPAVASLAAEFSPPSVSADTEMMESDIQDITLSQEEPVIVSDEFVDIPLSPVKSTKKKKSVNVPLPEFSAVLIPLLEGHIMSERDHQRLSSILKEELISYLNRENLICSANTSGSRWQYRDLGESLALKYPKMIWDCPSNRQKKLRSENAPIYTVFIKRLSHRRKMQRLRQKGKSKIVTVVEMAKDVEVSPEDAVSELQSVTSETAINCANKERIKELIKISYEIRRKEDISELPPFLMAQTHLETEVELRLGLTMYQMEKKLEAALLKMPTSYSVDGTILELEKLMQPKRATWSAITMGEYSSEQKRPGPSVFYGDEKLLLIGHQVLHLEGSCTLNRAVILLLGSYYLLNLNFPAAYGQFLGLVQNIIVDKQKFPKQFSSNHLLQVSRMLTLTK